MGANFIALFPAGNFGTNFNYDAGNFKSGDISRCTCRRRVIALALVNVGAVNACRMYFYKDFNCGICGYGAFLQL